MPGGAAAATLDGPSARRHTTVDPPPLPLASLVRRRRIQLRLTQRQAAERSGLSLATWQSLERRQTTPPRFHDITLAKAAHGLGLAAATLRAAAEQGAPQTEGTSSRRRGAEFGKTPQELVDELGTRLLRLAARSVDDFLVVYSLAIEVSDRLLSGDDPDRTA